MKPKSVLIDRAVVDFMKNTCKKARPDESGGLLLGLRKTEALHIIKATEPQMWDRSSPTRFIRSPKVHRIRALKEWVQSAQTVDWIGEWHSHPVGTLNPSHMDYSNWKRISKHANKEMCFAILNVTSLALYMHTTPLKKPIAMKLVNEDDHSLLYKIST